MTENSAGQRHDRSALFLYGTETGNSQDAAEQLGRIAERLRFDTRVCDMDAVEVSDLWKYTIVIFTIGTTGQGDMPANARKLWKSLLRKRLPPDCLSHVHFTTFGLGDSSYVKFNWAARKLHKRLEQLGAQEFYPRGEADEQHEEGTDGAFLPWSYNFKTFLLEKFPLPEGQLPIPDTELLPPKVTLELRTSAGSSPNVNASDTDPVPDSTPPPEDLKAMDGPITLDRGGIKTSYDPSDLTTDTARPPNTILPIVKSFKVTVVENKRITAADHWQDVRQIVLRSPTVIPYQPGDSVAIYPKNFPADVDNLIALQGWADVADLPLTFQSHEFQQENFMPGLINIHHVNPPTLRSLLIHSLDITSIPRRYFFEICAKYTTDTMHRDRLREFSNPVYTDEFFDYTTRPRRSCIEVLQDFPTVQLPWRWVLTIFPALRGRQYSISSGGSLKHPDSPETRDIQLRPETRDINLRPETTDIHLTIALVKYRTILRRIRQGVCSRYLASIRCGTTIAVTFHHGAISNIFFNQNTRPYKGPILMVAPGTGIAPMRALIYDRAFRLPRPTVEKVFSYEDNSSSSGDSNSTTENQQMPSPERSPKLVEKWEVKSPNPPIVLLYGGRNKDKDFLYQEEWEDPRLGPLKVLTAFSRDQLKKIYVQDVIRENADLVWSLLGSYEADPKAGNGTLFLCGSSGKMPQAIRTALTQVFMAKGKWTRDQAEDYLKKMEKEGRFVEETW